MGITPPASPLAMTFLNTHTNSDTNSDQNTYIVFRWRAGVQRNNSEKMGVRIWGPVQVLYEVQYFCFHYCCWEEYSTPCTVHGTIVTL